ncbi:MAG TPA: DUF3341 domain-containing protein [Gemmataceae bacterium]|nr:DUF3341 domain-containing protein [Gemmataceae bacterium]
MPNTPLHGLMAEFTTPEEILVATRRAQERGYRHVEAYTPYAVEGLAEALGMRRSRVPFVVLVAGLVGAGVGFFMQYWSMAVDYPFDVGGRPPNSWPVFIPITFEVMVLVASFAALFGMLFLNGLPKLYRPVFNVPGFARATQDRFFLCIETTDPRFALETTRQFLEELHPVDIVAVPQ